MKSMMKIAMAAGLSLAAGMTAFGAGAPANNNDWHLELTPYLWAAGINADVTVHNQGFTIDQKFKDLVQHVDAGAALLAVAQKDRWQVYAQGDYVSMNPDDNRAGIEGEIDANTAILTGGFGYEFDGFNDKSKIAVLVGARYTHMDNEVILNGHSSGQQNSDIVDALLILRPRYNFTDKFRFSPTMNIGAGDSDLTYELQPEFQYDITDAMSVRFGYRRVHYKEEFSDHSEFDGSMSGFIVGLGVML